MEERDLNCSEEKSYYPIMGDFATKVTKIRKVVAVKNEVNYIGIRGVFNLKITGHAKRQDLFQAP